MPQNTRQACTMHTSGMQYTHLTAAAFDVPKCMYNIDRKRYSLPKRPCVTVKQFLIFLHFVKRGANEGLDVRPAWS